MLLTDHYRKIMGVLFLGVIWLPLMVMLATPQREVSELENRRLASPPDLDLGSPHESAAAFERYFNDHFGFREQLIRLFRMLEVKVFQVSRAGNVIFGKDRWLFQAGDRQLADMRNNAPFSNNELAVWANVLKHKHQTLEERGIEYLFVMAPNKHLVYPDKLPRSVNRVSEQSRADQLIAHLTRYTDVPVLDLRPAMFEAKKHLRPYHKTDTHWNDWGAYAGYAAVIEYLRRSFPELSPIRLGPEDFAAREAPGGDLARALSMQDQLTEREIHPGKWTPRCAVHEGLDDESSFAERNNNPFNTRCPDGSRRLLMFRDSYSLAMMPYFSETFEYIHYFPSSPVPLEGMLKVIEEQRPDIVIEERSTRWLHLPFG